VTRRALSQLLLLPAIAPFTLSVPVAAQDLQPGANFTSAPAKVAQSTSFVEGARLADFDQDGDLDAVMTSGGTFSLGQARHWSSDASTAGGSFVFTDTTAARMPVLLSQAQSVEALDVDGDGDLDLHMCNTAQFFAQSNVWLINQGGSQGGNAGVFTLDLTRYSGIGLPGSSIASTLLINTGAFSGGFADWSHGCDFADVDLDGDHDLLQLSVGPSFGGASMHRLLRNSGGFFTEYNPSSAVSGATSLAAGSSAGWVEGTQAEGTSNSTGANHDITGVSFDADFGDLDGDLDLDLVVQHRNAQSRVYQNRFVENGSSIGNEGSGTRLYRDLTGALISLSQSGPCQDVELMDIDSDDDLDLWTLNYVGFADRVHLNGGTGAFSSIGSPLGDAGEDENEIDVTDYDADGDLDVFVSNFQGTNRVYKNLTAQGILPLNASDVLQRTGVLGVESELATPGTNANSWLSADAGDLDGDGDEDLFVSQDGIATQNSVQINSLGVADTTAPRLPKITTFGAPVNPTSAARRIVAQVYDNGALERLRDATGVLEYTVNGGPVQTTSARWAGGNLFTSEIPGYLFGSIQYTMKVTDRAGNTGASAPQVLIVNSNGLNPYGSSSPGCAGPHAISAETAPTIGNPVFAANVTSCPPNTTQLLIATNSQGLGGDPFGIGLSNGTWVDVFLASEVYALDLVVDASGLGITALPLPNDVNLVGAQYFLQAIIQNTACSLPPFDLSASGGLAVTILP